MKIALVARLRRYLYLRLVGNWRGEVGCDIYDNRGLTILSSATPSGNNLKVWWKRSGI